MIDTSLFETEISLIETRFLGEVEALLNRLSSLSKEEQLILLRDIDFMTRLNTNGLDKILNKMSTAMTKEINDLRKFYTSKGINITAGFTPLSALVQEDLNMFIGQYSAYSSMIKQNLIQGVAANTPSAILVKQLSSLPGGTLSGKEAKFLMEETYARFSSAVTATIFEDEKDTAKWVYIGPNDGRTRDSCRAVMEQGGSWTMDEINNGDAHSDIDFVSRGGFNCRHDWFLEKLATNE